MLKVDEPPPELDWIKLREELGGEGAPESPKAKMLRKIGENPFVPIGCAATTAALCYGLWTFQKGKSKTGQLMMRTRIAAQGFTVVALVLGIGMSAVKGKK